MTERGPKPAIAVRAARLPEDLEDLVSLYLEEARWHAERWPDDVRMPESGAIRRELGQLPGEPSLRLLVAELDGRVVGLVVASGHRRCGLGTLLLERIERWAAERGAGSIALHVHDGNVPAQVLYRRDGFRPVTVEIRKDLR